LFAKIACEIPYPEDDILFISDDIYRWQILDEFASSAYYAADYTNGYNACKILIDLLEKGEIPEEHRERFYENMGFYERSIKQQEEKKAGILKEISEKQEKERQRKNKNLQNKKRKRKKKKG
jgi:hypothetical protein